MINTSSFFHYQRSAPLVSHSCFEYQILIAEKLLLMKFLLILNLNNLEKLINHFPCQIYKSMHLLTLPATSNHGISNYF